MMKNPDLIFRGNLQIWVKFVYLNLSTLHLQITYLKNLYREIEEKFFLLDFEELLNLDFKFIYNIIYTAPISQLKTFPEFPAHLKKRFCRLQLAALLNV